MSDRVSVGDYSLEISGDEVLVRDQSGAIVESVDLGDVRDEFTLPDGRKIDLAAVLADQGVETLQTAAGPANDNTGYIDGGPTSNVSSAEIAVTTSYEASSSELEAQSPLGSGDDLLHISTASLSSLDMGDGYDTVHPAKQNLSFDHHEAGKLSDVEAIDATGHGANKVSLSINDVLDMTDSDNHLTIIGDKGDTVTLTGNANNNQWTVVDSNAEFTTYVWSDPTLSAVVEISNQLTAQVS